ncbi:MAG: hypothetical protein AAF242_13945, partial [Bacteroidota bacterium]
EAKRRQTIVPRRVSFVWGALQRFQSSVRPTPFLDVEGPVIGHGITDEDGRHGRNAGNPEGSL